MVEIPVKKNAVIMRSMIPRVPAGSLLAKEPWVEATSTNQTIDDKPNK